jgi:hypothetical protein
MLFFFHVFVCFATHTLSMTGSGTQEWLTSITSTAFPQTSIVHHTAALKQEVGQAQAVH